MKSLTSVFIVQHVHFHEHGEESVKMIGVYESEGAALEAVARLAKQPGFCDWPDVTDPAVSERSGFEIAEYRIGQDHWTEGYVTVQ